MFSKQRLPRNADFGYAPRRPTVTAAHCGCGHRLIALLFNLLSGQAELWGNVNQTNVMEQLRAAKPSLQSKYGVTAFALFGSVARGDIQETSDIDILVEFERPIGMEIVDLVIELETLLAHKVDLVSRRAIKPEMMKQIEPDLLYV